MVAHHLKLDNYYLKMLLKCGEILVILTFLTAMETLFILVEC